MSGVPVRFSAACATNRVFREEQIGTAVTQSADQARYGQSPADDLEGNRDSARDAVRIEQLRNHGFELLDQRFHIARFGGKTGYIVARGNPDARPVIPVCTDGDCAVSGHRRGSIARIQRAARSPGARHSSTSAANENIAPA